MGTVYLIKSELHEWYKIGYTAGDPKARAAAMQTGNPLLLEVYAKKEGDTYEEMRLHDLFKKYQLHGEWFSFHTLPNFLPWFLAKIEDCGCGNAMQYYYIGSPNVHEFVYNIDGEITVVHEVACDKCDEDGRF